MIEQDEENKVKGLGMDSTRGGRHCPGCVDLVAGTNDSLDDFPYARAIVPSKDSARGSQGGLPKARRIS